MTIVVTVKVTDGIVLAADSAATFYGVGPAPKIYNNANKIFNLVREANPSAPNDALPIRRRVSPNCAVRTALTLRPD
jgi:hypothetical protein